MSPQSDDEPTAFARWLASVVPAVIPSDAELARAIGASQSTILRWRRGAMPSTAYLFKLSKVTGTSVDTLVAIATHGDEGSGK